MPPRKRKTTVPAKRKGKPAARATGKPVKVKRASVRRRAAASSEDDIFIARTVIPVVTTPDDEEDEEAVFVARPGRPVEVQSDFVDDLARAPGGVGNDAWFAGLTPHANTPNGWTEADLRAAGLAVNRRGVVTCRYGGRCTGSTSSVPGVASHIYDCPYWSMEGKHKTPFDS